MSWYLSVVAGVALVIMTLELGAHLRRLKEPGDAEIAVAFLVGIAAVLALWLAR
jgi:zinc transporter ZupT